MLSTNKAPQRHLICLHGFLGLAEDWEKIEPVAPKGWNTVHENLWAELADYKTWAEKFCERVAKLEGTKVVLGYSLGGRLAMHALAMRADLFSGAILVSCNPGLKTDEERSVRVVADHAWAEKFRKLPWEDLMSEWSGQGAFAGLPSSIERKESEFDRELLAESLELWSLGYQRDLEKELSAVQLPILMITGAKDTKFTAIARAQVEKKSGSDRSLVVIKDAGHRVPWEATAEFRTNVANFLSRWYR
ncbi:MAG: alpha/beta fold hydrolase [Proteobacteria bacterium]|nr:MAG: alpha/beta fold hydrolase [Pseudomonadota bacterium]